MEKKFKSAILLNLFGTLYLVGALTVYGQRTSAQASPRQAALAFEQEGRTAVAEAAWKAIAAGDPKNAEAYAHLGLLEARQEHYNEAIAHYRKASAINPLFPNLRLNLGLSLFKSGNLKGAIQTFEPLLAGLPKGSQEAIRLETIIGLAHYGLGQYADAVPFLTQAAAADPGNLSYRMELAQSCLWSKQYQCVLDVYREILTLNPDSAEAHILAGEAYDGERNEAKAIEEFQAAIKADPKLPNVHFGYGYMQWRLLNFNEAEKEFSSELANDPEHPLALTYMGDTKIRLNQTEAAQPYLEHAIRVDPSITLAHVDMSIVYVNQGRNEDGLRELKTAATLAPGDQKIHWKLAQFYQSMGRKAEAKAEFDKTQTLQKSADESVLDKIQHAKPRPEGQPLGIAPK